jgi:hypothetical protein
MPRPPTTGIKSFIWLPKEGLPSYDIKLNGISIRRDMISAKFSKVSIPETGMFEIEILNSAKEYTGRFNQYDVVQLFLDRNSGTTIEFLGYIDKITDNFGGYGYTLKISGTHIQGQLTKTLVNENIDGSLDGASILNLLKASYMPSGWTIDYTATSTTKPIITWQEQSLCDCIADICNILSADAFVDDSKVLHIFDKGTRNNDNEAIVWNDTLISFSEVGYQSLTSSNSIKVYGDDGSGLPIIYMIDNTEMQTAAGFIKTELISDSSINTVSQAKTIADSQMALNSISSNIIEGDVNCFILETLNPSETIWVSDPNVRAHGQYVVYKVEHKFPSEQTIVTLGKERRVTQLFKSQAETNKALSSNNNPYKMTSSWNLTFDSDSDIYSKDTNVQRVGGKVSLSSGTQGIFSCVTTLTDDITAVHLRTVGSNNSLIVFKLSADGGITYQTLNLESITNLDAIIPSGTSIILNITMPNNTDIDSIALLMK